MIPSYLTPVACDPFGHVDQLDAYSHKSPRLFITEAKGMRYRGCPLPENGPADGHARSGFGVACFNKDNEKTPPKKERVANPCWDPYSHVFIPITVKIAPMIINRMGSRKPARMAATIPPIKPTAGSFGSTDRIPGKTRAPRAAKGMLFSQRRTQAGSRSLPTTQADSSGEPSSLGSFRSRSKILSFHFLLHPKGPQQSPAHRS